MIEFHLGGHSEPSARSQNESADKTDAYISIAQAGHSYKLTV
jgi:hypothetical protein